MSGYKVGIGFDVPLISMAEVRCTSPGIKGHRTNSGDGSVYEQARFVELVFSALGGAAAYQAVLSAFGLSSALFAEVTVYVRDDTWAWVRMNGVAVRPAIGRSASWDMPFPRNVVILVKDLEDAA